MGKGKQSYFHAWVGHSTKAGAEWEARKCRAEGYECRVVYDTKIKMWRIQGNRVITPQKELNI